MSAVTEDLTRTHREGQLQIRAQALRSFSSLWPIWNGDRDSFEQLVVATLPLVETFREASSAYASSYFTAYRMASGIPGTPAPVLAEPMPREQIVASLYVTGEVMTANALAAGQSAEAAMRTALARTSGAVGRHVLNGGRDTVMRSSYADKRAQGWQRVTGPNPCDFCEMLAARGPVYSESSADFQAHDHCSCAAEPSF